jgi:hypothetical protein
MWPFRKSRGGAELKIVFGDSERAANARETREKLERLKDPLIEVRVLKPFYFGGKPLAALEHAEMPRSDARELQAAGRLEILS